MLLINFTFQLSLSFVYVCDVLVCVYAYFHIHGMCVHVGASESLPQSLSEICIKKDSLSGAQCSQYC